MGLFNKKIVVLLIVIALCSGALLSHSAQPAMDKSTKPSLNNSGAPGDYQPNLTVGSHVNPSGSELFFKMMFMVLLVVALGIAVVYISKKIMPRFTRLPAKRISVIETVHLGPRKTIHLLKIDNRLLLIGSTNENMTKLFDVTDEPPEVDLSTTQPDKN